MGLAARMAHRRCRAPCRAGGCQARQPRLGGKQSQPRVVCASDRSPGRRRAAFGPARPRRQSLDPTDRAYIAACRKAETDCQSADGAPAAGAPFRVLCWPVHRRPHRLDQSKRRSRSRYELVRRHAALHERAKVRPYVLSATAERALKPSATIPRMRRGLRDDDRHSAQPVQDGIACRAKKAATDNEGPQHPVNIGYRFALSKYRCDIRRLGCLCFRSADAPKFLITAGAAAASRSSM